MVGEGGSMDQSAGEGKRVEGGFGFHCRPWEGGVVCDVQ
jgi:hypothetical protein